MRRSVPSGRTLVWIGLSALAWPAARLVAQPRPARPAAHASQWTLPAIPPAEAQEVVVVVGKSVILDSQANIQRVSVADGDLAEAVVVNPREILVNGKGAGETSLIIWQQGGQRFLFDLKVRPGTSRVQSVQRQLAEELPRGNLSVGVEDGNVYLRGTVDNLAEAERALMIAGTLGKPIDLLRVKTPQPEEQILLKVRFADIDRTVTQELGSNFISTGIGNTVGSIQTGQFPSGSPATGGGALSISDALNVFLFKRDLNLAVMLKALESKRVLQILAEPNVLAINGKPASFLAGGEFPYPTLQGGGSGLGQVTVQFREFGVRISFLPVITPRGTIRLEVTPEVSSLDYSNGLTFQGFTIPALSTRRVQTEIELETGQSFAIGGLLDNRLTESWDRIPGLGHIPLLGKLFQSRSVTKNNTELLVLVTPELVRPIPADQNPPALQMPKEMMKDVRNDPPRTPGMDKTGPVPVKPRVDSIPVEELLKNRKQAAQPATPALPPIQLVPVPVAPAPPPAPALAAPSNPPAKSSAGGGTNP